MSEDCQHPECEVSESSDRPKKIIQTSPDNPTVCSNKHINKKQCQKWQWKKKRNDWYKVLVCCKKTTCKRDLLNFHCPYPLNNFRPAIEFLFSFLFWWKKTPIFIHSFSSFSRSLESGAIHLPTLSTQLWRNGRIRPSLIGRSRTARTKWWLLSG